VKTAAIMGAGTALLLAATFGSIAPASALTMKECSAKYQEAQKAGTLNGLKWNDFRKAQCGSEDAAATPAAAPAAAPAKPAAAAAAPAKPAATAAAPAVGKGAVFPTAISPKYAKESAGKARMHTCLDQYNANKAAGAGEGNGGLNWIEKGGGYYSECNKRLKGA
jgi:hypothetical protein